MKKKIICYFSASGKTAAVAQNIADIIAGDLFEITPELAYSKEDLNWYNSSSRSSVEMNDITSRPALKNAIKNIAGYDTVIIGYPIWWGQAPRIINTFIENTDLTNKKVYLFATSGGSSINNSVDQLRRSYPNIIFVKGKLFFNRVTNDEVLNWLNED